MLATFDRMQNLIFFLGLSIFYTLKINIFLKYNKLRIIIFLYMYHTYIARCSDNSLYVGYTNDLKKRELTHNAGKGGRYTRARLPLKIVYSEGFETKSEAMSREYHLKKLSRKHKEDLFKFS